LALVDPEIEIIVTVNVRTGELRTHFVSPLSGSDSASELWWEVDSGHYILIYQDEYYDETLRLRRERNLMLSPRVKGVRMVFVGSVWGRLWKRPEELEISRAFLQEPATG
jgi:hypothetical protein